MITVSIVDDESQLRQSIETFINGSPGFRCLSAYGSAEAAVQGLLTERPDVVLMDIHMAGMNGIECVERLKELLPEIQIVMLTVYEDTEQIFKALAAGASGYLLKRLNPDKLLEAIREVHEGGSPMSHSIARKVVASFQKAGRTGGSDRRCCHLANKWCWTAWPRAWPTSKSPINWASASPPSALTCAGFTRNCTSNRAARRSPGICTNKRDGIENCTRKPANVCLSLGVSLIQSTYVQESSLLPSADSLAWGAATTSSAAVLWSDLSATLVYQTGVGSDILGGAVKRDDSSTDTLYFKFHVDPLSDTSTEEYFAAFELVRPGRGTLGVGNALKAWAYSAFTEWPGGRNNEFIIFIHPGRNPPGMGTFFDYENPHRGFESTIIFKVQYFAGGMISSPCGSIPISVRELPRRRNRKASSPLSPPTPPLMKSTFGTAEEAGVGFQRHGNRHRVQRLRHLRQQRSPTEPFPVWNAGNAR
jgi:DNA-binding NarL/FixJ family response regulator